MRVAEQHRETPQVTKEFSVKRTSGGELSFAFPEIPSDGLIDASCSLVIAASVRNNARKALREATDENRSEREQRLDVANTVYRGALSGVLEFVLEKQSGESVEAIIASLRDKTVVNKDQFGAFTTQIEGNTKEIAQNALGSIKLDGFTAENAAEIVMLKHVIEAKRTDELDLDSVPEELKSAIASTPLGRGINYLFANVLTDEEEFTEYAEFLESSSISYATVQQVQQAWERAHPWPHGDNSDMLAESMYMQIGQILHQHPNEALSEEGFAIDYARALLRVHAGNIPDAARGELEQVNNALRVPVSLQESAQRIVAILGNLPEPVPPHTPLPNGIDTGPRPEAYRSGFEFMELRAERADFNRAVDGAHTISQQSPLLEIVNNSGKQSNNFSKASKTVIKPETLDIIYGFEDVRTAYAAVATILNVHDQNQLGILEGIRSSIGNNPQLEVALTNFFHSIDLKIKQLIAHDTTNVHGQFQPYRIPGEATLYSVRQTQQDVKRFEDTIRGANNPNNWMPYNLTQQDTLYFPPALVDKLRSGSGADLLSALDATFGDDLEVAGIRYGEADQADMQHITRERIDYLRGTLPLEDAVEQIMRVSAVARDNFNQTALNVMHLLRAYKYASLYVSWQQAQSQEAATNVPKATLPSADSDGAPDWMRPVQVLAREQNRPVDIGDRPTDPVASAVSAGGISADARGDSSYVVFGGDFLEPDVHRTLDNIARDSSELGSTPAPAAPAVSGGEWPTPPPLPSDLFKGLGTLGKQAPITAPLAAPETVVLQETMQIVRADALKRITEILKLAEPARVGEIQDNFHEGKDTRLNSARRKWVEACRRFVEENSELFTQNQEVLTAWDRYDNSPYKNRTDPNDQQEVYVKLLLPLAQRVTEALPTIIHDLELDNRTEAMLDAVQGRENAEDMLRQRMETELFNRVSSIHVGPEIKALFPAIFAALDAKISETKAANTIHAALPMSRINQAFTRQELEDFVHVYRAVRAILTGEELPTAVSQSALTPKPESPAAAPAQTSTELIRSPQAEAGMQALLEEIDRNNYAKEQVGMTLLQDVLAHKIIQMDSAPFSDPNLKFNIVIALTNDIGSQLNNMVRDEERLAAQQTAVEHLRKSLPWLSMEQAQDLVYQYRQAYLHIQERVRKIKQDAQAAEARIAVIPSPPTPPSAPAPRPDAVPVATPEAMAAEREQLLLDARQALDEIFNEHGGLLLQLRRTETGFVDNVDEILSKRGLIRPLIIAHTTDVAIPLQELVNFMTTTSGELRLGIESQYSSRRIQEELAQVEFYLHQLTESQSLDQMRPLAETLTGEVQTFFKPFQEMETQHSTLETTIDSEKARWEKLALYEGEIFGSDEIASTDQYKFATSTLPEAFTVALDALRAGSTGGLDELQQQVDKFVRSVTNYVKTTEQLYGYTEEEDSPRALASQSTPPPQPQPETNVTPPVSTNRGRGF